MNPSSQNQSIQQQKQNVDQSKLQFPGNPGVALNANSFITGMPNFGGPLNPSSLSDYSPYLMTGDVALQEHMKKLKEKLSELKEEVEKMDKNPDRFKTHQLPLARVKKIMKSDEDVRMISAEAPVLFAKACELFIIELTHRAWLYTEEGKRRTLQKNDIAQCIANTDIFDFLIDIIPREEYAKTAIIKKTGVMGNMNLAPQFQYPSMNLPPQLMGNSSLLSSMNKGPLPNMQNQSKSSFNPALLNSNMMGWNGFPGVDKGMNPTKKDEM